MPTQEDKNMTSSKKLSLEHNEVFNVAVSMVINGSNLRFSKGQVMEDMTALFTEGKTLDGAEPDTFEIGRWGSRFACDVEPEKPVDAEMYFAWVNDDFWGYEPNLVFYTKAEFMELFADCCRNYVEAEKKRTMGVIENGIQTRIVFIGRDRTAEFAAAMVANGMTL
jgi:hypothetical protein